MNMCQQTIELQLGRNFFIPLIDVISNTACDETLWWPLISDYLRSWQRAFAESQTGDCAAVNSVHVLVVVANNASMSWSYCMQYKKWIGGSEHRRHQPVLAFKVKPAEPLSWLRCTPTFCLIETLIGLGQVCLARGQVLRIVSV